MFWKFSMKQKDFPVKISELALKESFYFLIESFIALLIVLKNQQITKFYFSLSKSKYWSCFLPSQHIFDNWHDKRTDYFLKANSKEWQYHKPWRHEDFFTIRTKIIVFFQNNTNVWKSGNTEAYLKKLRKHWLQRG